MLQLVPTHVGDANSAHRTRRPTVTSTAPAWPPFVLTQSVATIAARAQRTRRSTDAGRLMETWQLSSWHLELVLLHTFGYDGQYWSRLRLGRNVYDVEPGPWTDDAYE